jgi:hypothetical protein
MLPQLGLSRAGLVLVPDRRIDVKFAVQLGFMVMHDNPSWPA